MFEAKGINLDEVESAEPLNVGTAAGRGFAVAGGVAKAVADLIHETDPEAEVKIAAAEGLRECKKLMQLAKAGKYNGYLLEGMACPGGCVAGAGTMIPVEMAQKLVTGYQKEARTTSPLQSPYHDLGKELEEEE